MKRNDRYIWFGAGVGFLILIIAAVFAPTVLAQSKTVAAEEYLQDFAEIFRYIQENYVEEVDPKLLFEGALNGMFDTLDDPYSYYLDELDFASLGDTTTGSFGGVGLIISKQTANEAGGEGVPRYVEIVTPIEGTPAFKVGISAGDLIVAIEDESTENFSIDEVVDRLRGTPGTPVGVTIKRGRSTEFDVVIVRAIIEVPTVKYAMIDEKIGYVRITNFTPYTDDRVEDAVFDLQLRNYQALIIDVRNNPGGLLRSVIDTADLFLAGDTIVSTRSRIPNANETYMAEKDVLIPDEIPIIVLINKGSASASEILAGALRDNERAILIGETTYGKASVQDVRDLGDVGFKLTTARYFTPSGSNIDKTGIEPDTAVAEPELSDDDQEELALLTEERRISTLLESKEEISEDEIEAFIEQLILDGITLEERLIRRLIRNELNRTNNNPPIFDIEYDLALQEAVRALDQSLVSQSQ